MPTTLLKPDLERTGIFKEMSYHTIRDPYVGPFASLSSNFKGKQMTVSHAKSKSALSDGYFTEFRRTFTGDSKLDLATVFRMQRKEAKKLIRGKDWMPSSSSKPITSSGSTCDTFTGPIAFFKPNTRQVDIFTHQRNIVTSPGKKGSGSYVNVTLNPYPLHMADPYDRAEKLQLRVATEQRSLAKGRKPFYSRLRESEYFDGNPFRAVKLAKKSHSAPTKLVKKVRPPFKPSNPAKKDGGCKAGCFNAFPTFQSSPASSQKGKLPHQTALYIPRCCLPYPISSIVDINVRKVVNTSNYKRVKSVVYPL
ncbi:unnamed protein product [Dicrocoelium dendriticum]|nr:unnamed protein product [Dicrocoelium dendriticum]